MGLRLAGLVLVMALTARGEMRPEYEAQFSDVSHLRKALSENGWAKELTQSNLYRGALTKLGPVLFAVGDGQSDSWKGRLIDFVYEKILEGKRVGVSYFHKAGLVSPFGLTVFHLSAAEKTALSLILDRNKLGEAVEVEAEGPGKQPLKAKVQGVAIRLQKFAVVQGETCVAFSRDPKVALVLGKSCDKAPQKKGDAVFTVDLKEFFPAWYPVLDKLAGVGRTAELAFDYDKRQACFVPARADVALRENHVVGQGKIGSELLSAIPADTLLQVTAFLPDPGRLSEESVRSYFNDVRSKKQAVPVSLPYFGMEPGLNRRPEALSAVVLPQAQMDDALFADVNRLFNETSQYEVKFAKVCDRYLALSPSKAALDKISAAREKKQPSFAQMPQFLVKAMTQDGISAATVVNLGGLLKSALAFGWEKDNALAADGKKVSADVPREIAQAMDLLGRLPLYAFAGKAEKEKLALNGVKP